MLKLFIVEVVNFQNLDAFYFCETVTVPWPRSYKKDDESLPNLTGARSSCSIEKVLLCTQKRKLESLSKNRGFGVYRYSMNKTGGGRQENVYN
jgi:hypothetical protein